MSHVRNPTERIWIGTEYRWGAVLAMHKATESYLIWLFEDTNLCAIHTKHVTIIRKDNPVSEKNKGELSEYGPRK